MMIVLKMKILNMNGDFKMNIDLEEKDLKLVAEYTDGLDNLATANLENIRDLAVSIAITIAAKVESQHLFERISNDD